MEISILINRLLDYAEDKDLIMTEDRSYYLNCILPLLNLGSAEECDYERENIPLSEILAGIIDYAANAGIIDGKSVTERDLFDTKIMGVLTPSPRETREKFFSLYESSKKSATDWFYKMSRDVDYIRTERIAKNQSWKTECEFGELDITVNLSKPEKDPKAIAAAKKMVQAGYPKCLLCKENMGYAGRINHPARQSHRLIPMTMAGEDWFLQYSPYSYYNEHCIALSGNHTPMKIDRSTFIKLLDFVEFLPHYFLGSNADLPIVGGSILTHDHMQGGRYTFAMEKAEIEKEIEFKGFEKIKAGIVRWPMSVIRLSSEAEDKEELIELSDRILAAWRDYSDEEANVIAFSDGEPHNTVTPIARNRGGRLEMDLVLRCNITSEEHPLGIFHPHADKHNIKSENIGLIEVMGLAVLPARLKDEMATLGEFILEGKNPAEDEKLRKHAAWLDSFKDGYKFTAENTEEILRREIGKTFLGVLSDAGVYKCTEEGREHFARFVEFVNKL